MFDEIWDILSMSEYPDYKKICLLTSMKLYEESLECLEDGQKILEIGCGKGYGTFLLAKNLPNSKVVGIDINKGVIEFGKETWTSKNLNFEVMNILDSDKLKKIGNKHGKFDVVICFEVLEHISPDNTVGFLDNIKYLVDTGGRLLLSTPNKQVYDIDAYTEDHINEMNYEELTATLRKNGFKIMSIYGMSWLNKVAVELLLKMSLVHRKGDEHVNLSKFKWLLRCGILFIFAPDRIYCEILRRINLDRFRKHKYALASLRNKGFKYSGILLFNLKK